MGLPTGASQAPATNPQPASDVGTVGTALGLPEAQAQSKQPHLNCEAQKKHLNQWIRVLGVWGYDVLAYEGDSTNSELKYPHV